MAPFCLGLNMLTDTITIYPTKYAHNCVVILFIVIISNIHSGIMWSCLNQFKGYFSDTGVILLLYRESRRPTSLVLTGTQRHQQKLCQSAFRCVLMEWGNSQFYRCYSGLLHWHWGNSMMAPVPVKQPWRIWVNKSYEFPKFR